jgi:hypothetical protein
LTAGRLAGLVLAAVVAGGCWSGDALEPLPVPSSVSTVATSTTQRIDYSGVQLAPVEGTTTTTAVVIGPGAATVGGRVDGPDGPVEGATVRIERLVGDGAASLDVLTGPDGTWRALDVLGGRYRIRAWRQPDLAVIEAALVFVAGTGTTEVPLRADTFAGFVVDLAVAPDPPLVGERANVVVRVAERVVDDQGIVRPVPRTGIVVNLGAASGWEAESPLSATTDATGRATFTMVCSAGGEHGLIATIAPDQIVPLSPPECVERPPVGTATTGVPTTEG